MSAATLTFPTPASLGSLDHYIQSVNRFPLLTAEQEGELARRWQDTQDVDAARALVLSHLRLVVAVSRKYIGYGLPQGDLIQEGNVGLMKAVRRFDPDRGVRLVSFALHWIRAEMHEYILRNWRLVKVATTKAQRKLFFNLRSMKTSSHALTTAEAAAIAKELGVKPEEVVEMETRMGGHDIALDPVAERRRRERVLADRVADGYDRRACADPRAQADAGEPQRRSQGCAPEAGPAQPPHHRGALAEGVRPGDAAGAGRRVRRVRRAHSPDRGEGDEADEGRAARGCLNHRSRINGNAGLVPAFSFPATRNLERCVRIDGGL